MIKYSFAILLASLLICQSSFAQSKCDFDEHLNYIKAHNTSFAQHINAKKALLQSIADNYRKQKAEEVQKINTVSAPVPVIFHIVVDSLQFKYLGGITGIKQRCDSQIAVLNRDYNKQNSDSVYIPASWKPLYSNSSVGISFALARIDPNGNHLTTPGYEIRIKNGADSLGFDTGNHAGYIYPDKYSGAKHFSSGGMDAWDVTRYMNVWCINFNNSGGLMGITVPVWWTPSGGCDTTSGMCPADNEQGILLSYQSLGKRASPADIYPKNTVTNNYLDEGRTLTHEVGHFFELLHVWGDDYGRCPWTFGADDGLWDTPPQKNSTSGNPAYTISGGTITDACHDSSGVNVQPIGIACLDFLDYTDDTGMHMFTPDQAAVMAAMVSRTGDNIGLVRFPYLTQDVQDIHTEEVELSISPNPTTGILSLVFNSTKNELNQIEVLNIVGQEIMNLNITDKTRDLYSLNLSGMPKGMYLVQCHFSNTIVVRRVLLQ